jgi:hypothetical protein
MPAFSAKKMAIFAAMHLPDYSNKTSEIQQQNK